MIRLHLQAAATILWIVAGVSRADLPTDAQTAIEQGLSALETQDFPRADECFQKARALGPAADVYASLGRAEAKIPGRELRASCWLGAYLAAKPDAADAADVKGEIDRLQAKSQMRILALVQSAGEAATKMPAGEPRDQALCSVAGIWETLGDETQAQKTIDLIDGKGPKSDALSTLACAYSAKAARQFEQGDPAGSQASFAQAQGAVALKWAASGRSFVR